MLPNFLIEETTVRESGESPSFEAGENSTQDLVLTLGITHAVEQESIEIDILGSRDGRAWMARPLATFTPKSYCGTYQLTVPPPGVQHLKAVWKTQRWSRGDHRPFFRLYLHAQPARTRVLAASAA